jgi:prepilin-type N-terminal cleavage/methylation domain-containing protein
VKRHSPTSGFSLLELLTVIVILGILAGLGAPMITSAQRQARQADCRSNLRQFGIALASYRSDHNGRNPPWLSNLFPDYIDGKDIYVCKSDKEIKKGTSNYDPIPPDFKDVKHYDEVKDFGNGTNDGRNNDIDWNSYFYEFNAANCTWDSNADHDMDGNGVAWWEAKEWQLRYGDKKNDGGGSPDNPKPYSTARMPIIRCWHHWQEDTILGYEVNDYDHSGRMRKFPMVLNVGYAGNVFASPPWWEGRPDVGE